MGRRKGASGPVFLELPTFGPGARRSRAGPASGPMAPPTPGKPFGDVLLRGWVGYNPPMVDAGDGPMTTTSEQVEKGDFADLRRTGERTGTSWAIGYPVTRVRDRAARVLIRLGTTPNRITATGCVLTTAAAVCLAFGGGSPTYHVEGLRPSSMGLVAFGLLFLAGACDMLDGAVARIAGAGTRIGQLLDSTLDRFSDMALYVGLITHFALVGNVTLCFLCGLAMIHTYSVSYVKARADNLINAGAVGWWQRPERCFGFLVAALLGHMPAFIWQQATMPAFTVLRRLRHAVASIRAQDRGEPIPDGGPMSGGLRYLAAWRHARGSLAYDVMAALNIGWIVVAPWIWPFFYGRTDPLRALMERCLG
jgi:CDP-diacylglycerol--glycerol-3-phosphate 3-phosphatidyltransferase